MTNTSQITQVHVGIQIGLNFSSDVFVFHFNLILNIFLVYIEMTYHLLSDKLWVLKFKHVDFIITLEVDTTLRHKIGVVLLYNRFITCGIIVLALELLDVGLSYFTGAFFVTRPL